MCVEGSAKVVFEQAPFLLVGVHLRGEDAVEAAPVLLGAIERRVGLAQQRPAVEPVARETRDADARPDREAEAVGPDRLCQLLEQAGGELFGRMRLAPAALQDGELVSAGSGDDVAGPHDAAQPVGEARQQRVAGLVPQRVVDFLEAVEVEAHDRERAVRGAGRADRLGEAFAEQEAVGQAGQRVMVREVPDLRLRHAPLGHVGVGQHHPAARDRVALHLDDLPADLGVLGAGRLLVRAGGGHAQHRPASLADGGPGRPVGWEAQQAPGPLVDHRHAAFGVHHDDALADALERDVERAARPGGAPPLVDPEAAQQQHGEAGDRAGEQRVAARTAGRCRRCPSGRSRRAP